MIACQDHVTRIERARGARLNRVLCNDTVGIPTTAAHGEEEIFVHRWAGSRDGTIGQNDFQFAEAVRREAILRREVAQSATECQAGTDAG